MLQELNIHGLWAGRQLDVKASLTTNLAGADNDVTYTADVGGKGGNSISVRYAVAGNNTALSVTVAGNAITVNVATDGVGAPTSTATAVVAAVQGNAAAAALVDAAVAAGNTGAGIVAALAATNLAGGVDARDNPNLAPPKRLMVAGGEFNTPREDGSANFSDGSKFPGNIDWVNTLAGNGNPSTQAQPDTLAYQLWLHHGAEVVTNIAGPPAKKQHRFVPVETPGPWVTFRTRQGSSPGVIDRKAHNACRISQTVIEGSTANKNVRITQTIISTDPGQEKAADPVAALGAGRVFNYVDGAASYTADGIVYRGQSQFTLTINEDLNPVYGDDTAILDFYTGNAVITIGITMYLDADALALWNRQYYGTATPAPDARPIKVIPALGSYAFDLRPRDAAAAFTGDRFKLTMPGVKWAVPDKPGPNPDGGAAEIAVAGSMRKVVGQAPYTIDVENDDLAYTV